MEADDDQESRDRCVERERHDEDELSRQPVGELAGRKREQGQRQELGESDEPEVQRVARDAVDLPADRDQDHLAREAHRHDRGDQPRVVTLA